MKHVINVLPDDELIMLGETDISVMSALAVFGSSTTPFPTLPKFIYLDDGLDAYDTTNANAIRAIPGVNSCEHPDMPVNKNLLDIQTIQKSTVQALTPEQWGLGYISGRSDLANYFFDATGLGVTIYSVDTIAEDLAEFGGRLQQIYDPDAIPNTQDHGTATMCLAGGAEYGVAKEAQLRNAAGFNGDGVASIGSIVGAANACIDDFELNPPLNGGVLYMSLTSSGFISGDPYSAVVDRAVATGLIVIAAAGNGDSNQVGINLDPNNVFRVRVWPAENIKVMAIAAHDAASQVASFTNYGIIIPFYAPGVSNASLDRLGNEFIASGTSFSAPFTAGCVACALSAGISDTQTWIKDLAITGVLSGVIAGANKILYKPPTINGGAQPPSPPPPVTAGIVFIDGGTPGNMPSPRLILSGGGAGSTYTPSRNIDERNTHA